jgi:hypothetical protein
MVSKGVRNMETLIPFKLLGIHDVKIFFNAELSQNEIFGNSVNSTIDVVGEQLMYHPDFSGLIKHPAFIK